MPERSNEPDATTNDPLIGIWRIIETAAWDADALDLVGPACIEFEKDGMGSIHFIAVRGGIDYRVSKRDETTLIEFTWEGISEGDPICGRATAVLDGDELVGDLFIHYGDESGFIARRAERSY